MSWARLQTDQGCTGAIQRIARLRADAGADTSGGGVRRSRRRQMGIGGPVTERPAPDTIADAGGSSETTYRLRGAEAGASKASGDRDRQLPLSFATRLVIGDLQNREGFPREVD